MDPDPGELGRRRGSLSATQKKRGLSPAFRTLETLDQRPMLR
ncbi:hypothetical protein SynRS9915_00364 [Synechococcus sp. RS9915]|nr:hypothetical protein SynRS9915_00364 [Synechococcus sp. RS9915]